jgi:hypothetical protein
MIQWLNKNIFHTVTISYITSLPEKILMAQTQTNISCNPFTHKWPSYVHTHDFCLQESRLSSRAEVIPLYILHLGWLYWCTELSDKNREGLVLLFPTYLCTCSWKSSENVMEWQLYSKSISDKRGVLKR